MASPAEVRAYIEQQAKTAGLTPNDIRNLVATAQIESSMGQNVASPKSTARGVFQFINSTGAKYGLNGKGFDDRLDYKRNIDAGIQFYKDNQRAMTPTLEKLGIPVDDATANYMAHQQGVDGAKKVYNAVGSGKPIEQVIGAKAAKNNAMAGKSVDEALSMWGGKIAKADSKNGLSMPTMASARTTPPMGIQPPLPPAQVAPPKGPAYLTGETPSTTPTPYAPMLDPLAALLPPPNAPIPSTPAPNMLSSTLIPSLGQMPGIPTPEPEPVTLASIIKQAADVSGNAGRNTLSSGGVDPMVYDIMRLIENS